MIPEPVDPGLLREHAFYDSGDLGVVLSKDTYTEFGGFKSIFKYGLGYFNYASGLDREVHERSLAYMLKFHILQHFGLYCCITMVALVVSFIALSQVQGNAMGRNKKAEKDGDDVYYVKV
ncbi:hypothetical protein ACU8KH_03545 [Lachancea thermotolerans]|uniref:KLTH0F02178p n=1 Tax=Lachancea thermotolerans (strain ATCC 56472 / CBS 6340 / NRRL Y-8284) TaxID=559295 RepID=C5DK67_LACTC|nr:KLTH0F02178p [Lachancea thermotolerans CBS 6340]CAR23868.1 KLTH0F02178p [Lachancea thermotolerans CBS 6340]